MTTAVVAQGILPERAGAAGAAFKPFVLILSGCDPKVNPETLFNLIDPIVSHNIPIGYAVATETSNGEQVAPDAYIERVRGLSSDLPGLVELLPVAAGLHDPIPYFLARRAFDVYGRFQAVFDLAPNSQPVSLFSPGGDAKGDGVAGIRSSGFRSVYLPGKDPGVTRVLQEPNGVMSVSGGIVTDVTAPIEAFRKSLDLAIQGDDFIFVNLSLAGLTGLSPEYAFQRGSELAVAIARKKALGQIVANLPRDFHLRIAESDYNRAISVCVDMTKAGSDLSASYAEFVSTLETQSIAVTRIIAAPPPASGSGSDRPDTAPFPVESCRVLDGGPVAGDVAVLANGGDRPRCAALFSGKDQELKVAVAIGLSTLLDLSQGASHASGLDGSGILRIAAAVTIPGGPDEASPEIAGKLPGLMGNHRDAVIVIDARSLATSSARNLIVTELSELAAQSWSRFEPLSRYSNTVVPDFNHLELIRQSKFDRYVEARETRPAILDDKARLMEQARQAWQYFANETHEKSGFTPSTVFRSEDFKSNYEVITMWDVTSHLNGLLCAAELGIIPRDDMVKSAGRILKNLPIRKIAGLNLPVGEFHYVSGQPLSMDYNSCDVGRLLVSLHLLSRVAELAATVRDLVAGLDLQQTVRDGKMMDIRRQKMIDSSRTNCSHYASIGYGLWGVEANSPYRTPDGEGEFDRSIRLLDVVGNIGLIGAEPLLLEEVELGFSPASEILAGVLYSAQLSEFRRSGTLVAVSETPLDREPWFIYQGLDVNDADAPWKVTSIIEEARFRTAGFTYANRMLGTKAAMLWGAVRPSDFSEKLVARAVKDTVLPGLGYAVGIYQSTDQPTFGYSGMNTNGVILEAVAYALRGRKPMNAVQF